MTELTVPDHVSLGEARDRLRQVVDEGAKCPCCTQMAKVYPRTIHATMARELITCYRNAGLKWFHLPTILGHNGGDVTKCRYWGLMEEETTVKRPDGGRAGYWRVTDHGRAFIFGSVAIPKYARIFNSRCLRLDGNHVDIRDCLGKKFNYTELMADIPRDKPTWIAPATPGTNGGLF